MKLFLFLLLIIPLQNSQLKNYTLENHKIDISFDENWKFEKMDENTFSFIYNCEASVPFCKNIMIKVIENTNNQTVDELTKLMVDWIPTRYDLYKIVNVGKESINGRNYNVIDYMMKEENIDLGNTTLVTYRDTEFIAIYFTALNQPERNYVNERKILYSILNTIKIK